MGLGSYRSEDYGKLSYFSKRRILKVDLYIAAYPRHTSETWPLNPQRQFCVLQQCGAG